MNDVQKSYDSLWLERYFAAKEVIARVAPSRLQEFIDSFGVLRTDAKFKVKNVSNFFDDETLGRVKDVIRGLPRQPWEMHEFKRFGRIIVHNNPEFTRMQAELADRVSGLVGEAVEPSYNFLSLYMRMGVCEPHLDAPLAK